MFKITDIIKFAKITGETVIIAIVANIGIVAIIVTLIIKG
jgi:hypothetical protein